MTDVDVTPPVITGCPVGSIVLKITPGVTYALIEWDLPQTFDATGPAVLVSVSGARSPTFVKVNSPPYDVEYVFEDSSGNQATCRFTIGAVGKSLILSMIL